MRAENSVEVNKQSLNLKERELVALLGKLRRASVYDLARHLPITYPTVGSYIKRLTSKGLVVKVGKFAASRGGIKIVYELNQKGLELANEILKESTEKKDQEFTPRVFISYSYEDRTFVDRLVLDLKSRNVDVWTDTYEIKGGESILEAIEDAVQLSDVFIIVLSPNSLSSNWVKNEMLMISDMVITKKRIIIPVLVQNCAIPLFLRVRKWIDFTKDYELALHDLIASLEHWGLQKRDRILISMTNELEAKRNLSRKALSDGYSAIGKVAIRIKRYDEAKRILERAIRILPNNPDPHHLLGIAMSRLGRFADAEDILRRLAAEGPHKARADYNLACLYSKWAQVVAQRDSGKHSDCLKSCYKSLSKAFDLGIVEWLSTYASRKDPLGDILGDQDLSHAIRTNPKVEELLKDIVKKYDYQWRPKQVYAGSSGCLTGNNRISTESGALVPIRDIICGEIVISGLSGSFIQTSIIWRKMRYLAESGICINNKLTVTAAQRVLTTRGWRRASELCIGEVLLGFRKKETVHKIDHWKGTQDTYHLGLQGRPFFVAEGIFVHNDKSI